ncbi:hypothetical protein BH11MYX4_BH11MYX4_12800 [soil metagenome]
MIGRVNLHGERRRRWLWVGMLLTVALTIGVALVAVVVGGLPSVIEFSLVTPIVATATSLVLLRRGRQEAAGTFFIAAIWSIVMMSIVLSGGLRSPIALSLVSTTVMAGAVGGARTSLAVAVLSAATLAVVALLGAAGWPAATYVTFTPLFSWLIQAASLTFAGYLMFDMVRVLNRGLERANEGERALRDLVQTAPEGIVSLDAEGSIVQLNPAASRALGMGLGSSTSLYELAWVDPASVRELFEGAASDAAGGVVAALQHSSGEVRELELIGHGLPQSSVTRAVHRLSIRDVTDRRRAERERDRLETRLRQAERLEALGLLAGGVSHDFNNLVTVVLANAQLLLDTATDPEAREGLREIVMAAERSTELTRQLLAFGRKQVLQPVIMKLSDVVRKTLPMVRRLLREDIEAAIELDDALFVKLDEPSMVQVLMNLVSNARDAMPGGGQLSLRCYRASRTGGEIPDGEYAVLEVTDTGEGFSTETRARMFEPFFTTKASGRGTGLGLSVVQSIIAQSGAFLEVTSEPGRGTSISALFTLQPAPRENAAIATVNRRRSRGASILLVEDDAAVRAVARRVLVAAGHDVLEAQDGQEALVVAGSCERIDLLLSDIVMPKMGGVQLARTLVKLQPRLLVVLMSGYVADAFGPEGQLTEGYHFVAKPFTPDQLLAGIDAALDSTGSHLTPRG